MSSTSHLSVLNLLRRQVADLSRELAERDSVLHERTRHLRVAQSLAHLGSWDWEIDSGEVRCSNELYRIFGHEPGSHRITFEIFVSAVLPDDHDRVVASIDDALGGKAPYDVEYRIVRPDGEVRTLHCCGEVLRDDNGKPRRMSGSVLDITDRKRMEEAARESEDRYRTLVELSPSGVFVFCEGRTVYVNHTGAVLMGANDSREILERPMFDFIHPDYHHEVRENVKRLLAGRASVHSAERIYLKKDGTPIPVQVETARIMWNGRPAILGLVSDVTDRKQAEEALRASEERFAKAFQASPHPVVISEIETGRLVDVNDAAYKLLGYRKEDIEGRTALEIGIWDSAEERTRFVDVLKRMGSVRNEEVTLRSKNGEVRQVLLSSELIELNGKQCSVTVGDDITDRKRAEDQLRRSHTFLRQVIDTDPNFIFAKDREGRFTMVNKAVADCYGTTVENLVGQSDADFNPNGDEVEFSRQKELQVMNSLQECFIAEEKITDWSGKRRWLQTIRRPIVDDTGRAHMVLGAATDITERKRMEEMLRQRERDLSTALQERERISQDLHDGILQSLYAVGLGLEACKPLIRQQPAQVAEQFMTTLDQAIGQLNHVMGEVRNFIAGLESHLLQGGDFPTALRTMVHTMCGSSSAKCRVRIDDAAGDHISTEQALHIINIVREGLSNSLRHSQATGIIVSLRQFIGSVRLAITDNGIGFNPRSAHGVGHGLENMAARAQKVGGLFAIRSEPYKGTRILLDLPKDMKMIPTNTHVSGARGESCAGSSPAFGIM
jgi:PAS domain S-box-containing protein